jgi:predicted nucleotidyltransferase
MTLNSSELRLMLRLLLQEGAEVVLIGGLAAVALGVPYVTNDVDLCYNPDPPNLSRLVHALVQLHPRLRVGRVSDDDARMLPFHWDERTLRDSPIMTLQTDAGPLDLMSTVPGIGSYAKVRDSAVFVDLFGLSIRTLDLPGLIASKRASARPKDLMALPHIEATLRLRELEQLETQAPEDHTNVSGAGEE